MVGDTLDEELSAVCLVEEFGTLFICQIDILVKAPPTAPTLITIGSTLAAQRGFARRAAAAKTPAKDFMFVAIVAPVSYLGRFLHSPQGTESGEEIQLECRNQISIERSVRK